jgi:hypothetical protein
MPARGCRPTASTATSIWCLKISARAGCAWRETDQADTDLEGALQNLLSSSFASRFPAATRMACLVLRIANRIAFASAVRDHHQHRLPAKLEAALQDFQHTAVGMFVELVDKGEVRTRTRAVVSRDTGLKNEFVFRNAMLCSLPSPPLN